ncbi:MAG: hypothetical protein IPJ48_04610 [Propionivibrio sp.]|uniref:Uncharacterized protein n=1 Tax=Candidatus Propionivibrio dominans TaxID=2954373 RepID=A0A9D7F5L9_9RHOO|nr:hypothetical protein [Candidatus Propionivibrio dominans]
MFVAFCNPATPYQRKASWLLENPGGRWRSYDHDELIVRDRVSLDTSPFSSNPD